MDLQTVSAVTSTANRTEIKESSTELIDRQHDNTVSIDLVDTQHDSTVSIDLVDTQQDSTVSIDLVDTQHDSTVSIDLVDTQHDSTVSIDLVDTQHDSTVSIDLVNTQHDSTVSIDLVDTQQDSTVSIDLVDTQQDSTMSIDLVDTHHDSTVSMDLVDTQHDSTVSIDLVDTQHDSTMSIDLVNTQHDSTVSIDLVDSNHFSAVSVDSFDGHHASTVSIDLIDSQHDSTEPFDPIDNYIGNTAATDLINSHIDSTSVTNLINSMHDNTVATDLIHTCHDNTEATDLIQTYHDNTVATDLIRTCHDNTMATDLIHTCHDNTVATDLNHSYHDNTVATDLIDSQDDKTVPIDLHVKRLSYTVTDNPGSWWQKLTNIQMPWEWFEVGRTNHVLQDVSFTAKSGQLMAIMGGSGSGKTSLLDVLAYRTTTGTITGQVYLNTTIRTKALLDACSGYVRQDDRLIGSLTTRETLTFVAQLKLPRKFTRDMINNRVDTIIAELGLKHAADTKVGDANIRGLSGGERRRVSIGIQLLILPSILFLDEPTSGLDSFTARNLVQTLSRLALRKRTIIMSIHQPRFDIFSMVDTMMILSRARLVYNGPGKDIVRYFASLGFPCPLHTNPCDFCIDLATVDTTTPEREDTSLKIVQKLHEAYQAVEELQLNKKKTGKQRKNNMATSFSDYTITVISDLIENRQPRCERLETTASLQPDDSEGPILITQFYILLKRFIRVKADNYVVLLNHMVQALFMSLLLGVTYIDLKYDEQSIRDWMAVMFNISVMYPFMVILTLIGACHDERRFLYFELQDRLYSPSAYYFARVLSDVPFHLVYVLIYCIPVYGIAGLKTDTYTCCMFFLFVSVSVFTSRSLAMMSAALLPTYQLSSMLAQIFFSLFIMGAGFFINLDSIMPETKWISSASYLRWSYEALCIIGITSLQFHDNATGLIISGEEVLKANSLGGVELWHCAIGLGVPMLVFLIIMFVGLKFIPQKPLNE